MTTDWLIKVALNVFSVYIGTKILTKNDISERILFFLDKRFRDTDLQFIADFISDMLSCFLCTSFWVSFLVYVSFPMVDPIGNDIRYVALYMMMANTIHIVPRMIWPHHIW